MTFPAYVFAFDPGKMTGWALWKAKTGEVASGEDELYPFYDRMDAWFPELRPKVFGENYIVTAETGKKTQAPWSLNALGVADFLCHKYKLEPLKLQKAADAKSFCTNDRIRAMGWWVKGTAGHDKDALRHLMIGLISLGWTDERIL